MELSLTTTEAIRAVLGISGDGQELTDEVFTASEIEDEINLDLEIWLSENADTSISVIVGGSNTQAKVALAACAKYLGALLLLPSLTTATAKKLSDGQDEFQRQDRDIPQIREDLLARLEHYRGVLLGALEATPITPVFSLMGRAIPGYDPITNT